MIYQFKEIFKIRKMKFEHFIVIDYELYDKYKMLIWLMVFINSNYKKCEIFKKRHGMHYRVVVVGLKWGGRNVKRRTSGFAKDYLNKNRHSKCIYCECKLTYDNVTADHIIPISKGGSNCKINLMVCCHGCNSERGNIPFDIFIKSKNIRYRYIKRIFI